MFYGLQKSKWFGEKSLFYMLFLEGHFVNVLEFANVHQFDRFGSFFEPFFSGFVFAILVLAKTYSNCVKVREN